MGGLRWRRKYVRGRADVGGSLTFAGFLPLPRLDAESPPISATHVQVGCAARHHLAGRRATYGRLLNSPSTSMTVGSLATSSSG